MLRQERKPFHPLLTAAEIEDSMQTFPHMLDPGAVRSHAYMSDILGLQGLGVVKVNLPAGNYSCTPHYHLTTTEWLYILKGSGHLVLLDASSDCPAFQSPLASSSQSATSSLQPHPHIPHLTSTSTASTHPDLPREERPIAPGDFIGLPGGVVSARWTHTVRAGPEGLEYLVGGERKDLDVVGYPTVGQTVVFNHTGDELLRTYVPPTNILNTNTTS